MALIMGMYEGPSCTRKMLKGWKRRARDKEHVDIHILGSKKGLGEEVMRVGEWGVLTKLHCNNLGKGKID